jgi:NAD(P)-dependent dehydrogenase (short-subunit alcohol dehydrogenase family)
MHRLEPQLHILINNAYVHYAYLPASVTDHPHSGVMIPPIDLTTSDGYDLQFGTNVLGHFYLTKLLLPVILAASTPTVKARVVTVASSGAFLTKQIRYELLKDGPERKKVGTQEMYAQSKLVCDYLGSVSEIITNKNFKRVMHLLHASLPAYTATRLCQLPSTRAPFRVICSGMFRR